MIQALLVSIAMTLVACRGPDIHANYGVSFHNDEFHKGVDFADRRGAPVIAAADGVVAYTYRRNETDYVTGAKGVVLWHPEFNLYSGYNHLSRIAVTAGAAVKRGQQIGTNGTSGLRKNRIPGSIPAHVHLSLRTASNKGNCPIKPDSSCCEPDRCKQGTIDPLKYDGGCFDPDKDYPENRFVLTYPVQC
ncbi:MAG: M23 family metallopeptidase [Gammaproteobacteria bacterium]|nr:M23 family metallopeptidase [Gammaproteobacteria bacterium]